MISVPDHPGTLMEFCIARRMFILWMLALLLVSRSAVAEDPDIARLFVERGLTGTLVLSSLQTDKQALSWRQRLTREALQAKEIIQ
ncbi:hypothetical protein [Allochromatium palmeri]|uniref:Uncharacterized protein n=1 Tax=Allochromatium palmeri TaxID=231048 RepID=A0A6N8EJY5_9GAMM|nr:hypothetical protein [Allochromatium palmeri]MTW23066.1 hypothetical protein [Allochromatium palmeri]